MAVTAHIGSCSSKRARTLSDQDNKLPPMVHKRTKVDQCSLLPPGPKPSPSGLLTIADSASLNADGQDTIDLTVTKDLRLDAVLSPDEIACLAPCQWLTGNVILHILRKTCPDNYHAAMIDFEVREGRIYGVPQMAHHILVPYLVRSNHWVLIHANLRKRTVDLYDSNIVEKGKGQLVRLGEQLIERLGQSPASEWCITPMKVVPRIEAFRITMSSNGL